MRNTLRFAPLFLAIGLSLLVAACGDGRDDTTADGTATADQPMDGTTPATTPGQPADSAMPSDVTGAPGADATGQAAAGAGAALDEGDALGVLNAINTAEVEAGNLALRKNVDGPVREYAQRMVREHGENNQQIQGWSPDTAAPAAQAQAEKGRTELSRLEGLDGDEFERAYVEAMVRDHQEALRMLDERLIPAATRAEVRQHLQTTRGHVASHLEAARALQGNAGGTAAQ
ncbi:MAG TPA: DUF4142 domain-containing protein [Pseudoxanthomonas sp.]|nr:DUF4142 domain-containing protein [Pseudoxanthomonas sp.]